MNDKRACKCLPILISTLKQDKTKRPMKRHMCLQMFADSYFSVETRQPMRDKGACQPLRILSFGHIYIYIYTCAVILLTILYIMITIIIIIIIISSSSSITMIITDLVV